MPKAEKGSLKDIGKRIKAKGLQKLKFYCQMCEKQCRDANGFKCHLTSESHLRQMSIFASNATGYMNKYSQEFEKLFLDTLRMRHGTSRTNANHVYQEVIQDKVHIHMNATIWVTLTDFCKYLGKTGKCMVEETERGWYITYIEQNVVRIQREQTSKIRLEQEQWAEQMTQQTIEQQRIEAAKALDRVGHTVHIQEPTKLERSSGGGGTSDNNNDSKNIPIQLKLNPNSSSNTAIASSRKRKKISGKSIFDDDDDNDDEHDNNTKEEVVKQEDASAGGSRALASSRTKSATQQQQSRNSTTKESDNYKQTTNNNDNTKNHSSTVATANNCKNDDDDVPWLYRGIYVRIINQDIENGRYFRCKGIVNKVLEDGYTAQVTVQEDARKNNVDTTTTTTPDDVIGDIIQFDQEDLETVAPKHVNEKVRIVRGSHSGRKALVRALDKKKCRATLELYHKDGGDGSTTLLDRVSYDDFSKC